MEKREIQYVVLALSVVIFLVVLFAIQAAIGRRINGGARA